MSTPAANSILSGGREVGGHETRTITPVLENSRIRWANVPKEPIPELKDVSKWIGHQLNHKRMPKEYLEIAPRGHLLTSMKGYPEGLLGISNPDGSPRIIVPRAQILALVSQTHEDIHHQSHVKVLYVLKPLFYWSGMTKDIENICTACQICMTASVRRRHLKAKFDPCATINHVATSRLWHRLLWSTRWRDYGHRRSIHERNDTYAFKQQNTRQCCSDIINAYHI